MDTLEAITTRRSIRRFTREPVSEVVIRTLLTAAMSGPSAANQQPWQFVVVSDRSQLDRLASFGPFERTLSAAPHAVAVCGDMSLAKWEAFWPIDCAVATQNLLLAAHAHGLGAVWLGCSTRAERAAVLREVLELPEHVQPFALVPIGFAAEEIPPIERYQADRVHRDRWSTSGEGL